MSITTTPAEETHPPVSTGVAPAEVPKPDIPFRSTTWRSIRELLHTVLLIAALYTLVNLAIPRYVVEGRSMQPSFDGAGNERVIVSRIEYIFSAPQRGDIIVLNSPSGSSNYIKRIVGLPGEEVHLIEGKVLINGQPVDEPYVLDLCNRSQCQDKEWVLGADEYFVLGDNRNNSHDSTSFGPIPRSKIVGRAWIRYWPLNGWGIFRHYDYSG